MKSFAAIAIKLWNHNDDPYFMEPSDLVAKQLRELDEPIKASALSEMMHIERKVIDRALKSLKEDDIVASPKRGYWILK